MYSYIILYTSCSLQILFLKIILSAKFLPPKNSIGIPMISTDQAVDTKIGPSYFIKIIHILKRVAQDEDRAWTKQKRQNCAFQRRDSVFSFRRKQSYKTITVDTKQLVLPPLNFFVSSWRRHHVMMMIMMMMMGLSSWRLRLYGCE